MISGWGDFFGWGRGIWLVSHRFRYVGISAVMFECNYACKNTGKYNKRNTDRHACIYVGTFAHTPLAVSCDIAHIFNVNYACTFEYKYTSKYAPK